MARVVDGLLERLGEADGGEQRKVGVFGLAALVAVGVAVDGQHAVGVLGDHAAALVKAEHPGLVAVLLGAVPDLRLIDALGKVLPDDGGQLDANADVHLVIFQRDAVAAAPAGEEAAAHPAHRKDHLAGVQLLLAFGAAGGDFQRLPVHVGDLGVGEDVAAGTQLFDQTAHRLKVGVGAQVLELRLVHVQIVRQAQLFELIVRQKPLGRRAERDQNLVGLLDVVDDRLRL